MKHKFFVFNFLIAMVSILLLGCASKKPEEIASMIRVSYPVSQEMSVGTGITIELTNESNYCVVFPVVTGMKIYTKQGENLLEVKNLINIGDENFVLNSKNEVFHKIPIDVVPDTSKITITKPIQFFVSHQDIYAKMRAKKS